MDSIISAQRTELFNDIDIHSDSLIEVFRELAIVTQSLDGMMDSITTILNEGHASQASSSDFTLSDARHVVEKSTVLTENIKEILEFISLNDLVHEKEMQEVSMMFDKLIFKIFLLATCLMIISNIIISLGVLYVRKNSPRM